MQAFADRTGLSSGRENRRYLWTDAFAVCNWLGLARATGDARHTRSALLLIERVHGTLSKHRGDDGRTGFISGLDDASGGRHPTRGGLRIGKALPERRPRQPFDAELEWERDGQYFHYLVKWMHALAQAARATGDLTFHTQARELAAAAYRGFVRGRGSSSPRMVWKMSIDLSRPLVTAMGQHDPVDGFVTYAELAGPAGERGELGAAMADFETMLDQQDLDTDDPLGIGGLLTDAVWLDQLGRAPELRDRLLRASLSGLAAFARSGELDQPAERRLAFRELGLAIGLRAAEHLEPLSPELARHQPLAQRIIELWLDPQHQRAGTWLEHRDIDEVMLATALAPQGFVVL